MAKKPPGMTIMLEHREIVEMLSNEEAGEVFKALFAYCQDGEITNFQGCSKMAFTVITNQLNRSISQYQKKCEQNADNVNKRWENNRKCKANEESEHNRIQFNTNVCENVPPNTYEYDCIRTVPTKHTPNVTKHNQSEIENRNEIVGGGGNGEESGGVEERGVGEEGAEGKGKPKTLLSEADYTAVKKAEALKQLNSC